MSDAFVFLSYRPQQVAARLKRFHESLQRHASWVDTHVVTFDRHGQAGTIVERFDGVEIPHTTYNVASVAALAYPRRHSPDYRNFQDGFVDLPVILFGKEHPQYRRIWVAEDDVEYSGEFGALVASLEESDDGAGLSCTHLRDLPAEWDHTHLYSPGLDVWPTALTRRVCFLPFFGVTPEALRSIDGAYRRGWTGHNEMTWPMILDLEGIRIRDIGGDGPFVAEADRQQRYIDRSPSDFRKLGSFGTLNIRIMAGRTPDMLWHPVKRPRAFVRMRVRRARSILQWYRRRMREGLRGLVGSATPRRLRGARSSIG